MPPTELMRALADAYAGVPPGPPATEEARASYDAFIIDVSVQYLNLPVAVERWQGEGQPYGTSRKMFDDVEHNGRLLVFTGGEDHPYLTRDQNVMFRAVHDYYGHFLGRFQFGPRGEFMAWRAHAGWFSPLALPALAVETLGQNAWVNFGPFSHLPPAQRPYAEQKANLLPAHLWEGLLR